MKPTDRIEPRFSINGHRPKDHSPGPLRFVFLGASIVSDWDNPAATSVRAVMRALTAAGHEAIFLEERRNRPTVELLRARGSAPLRAFAEQYPDLHYRTYDLPRGLERTVWFVRQIATADAVVVLDGAPAGVVEEAARLDARHLTRVAWTEPRHDDETDWADLRLVPAGTEAVPGALTFGPAVERLSSGAATARSGVLLVAYDDADVANAARDALAEFAPECLSAGAVAGAAWPFVPEVALPDRYRRAHVAVVVGTGDAVFAAARRLLPLGAGVPSVVHESTAANLRDRVASLLSADRSSANVDLPAVHDAAVVANRLVEAVRQARLVRLS
jgi:hypothetical protein